MEENKNQGLSATNDTNQSPISSTSAVNKIDLTKENIESVASDGQVPPTIPAAPVSPIYNDGNGVAQVHIDEPIKKKASKKKIAILVLIVALIAIVAGLVLYFLNRPKVLFFNSVNTTYNDVLDKMNESKGIVKDYQNKAVQANFSASTNLQTSDPSLKETADILNNLKLNMVSGVDFKNKTFAYNLDLQSSNTSLINSYFYGKEKNMYIELKDLFSKYIKVDFGDDYEKIFSDKIDADSEYFLSTLKDIYLGELKDEDFTKTKDEILINGKKVKTTKVSLNLNEVRIKEINSGASDKLVADEKFVKAMANIGRQSESDVKTALKEVKNLDFKGISLTIDIYLDKKAPIEYVINAKEDISDFTISGVKYGDYFDLTVKQDDQVMASMTSDKDSLFINLDSITIEVTKASKEKYDISIKSGFDEIKGTYTYKEKEISENERSLDFTLILDLDTATKLTISGTGVSKVLNEINIPDVSNNVDVNSLTEEDLNTILENLIKNPEFTKLFGDDLGSMMGDTESTNYTSIEDDSVL